MTEQMRNCQHHFEKQDDLWVCTKCGYCEDDLDFFGDDVPDSPPDWFLNDDEYNPADWQDDD